MSYREHAPGVALAPWLECLWERVGDGAPVRVLPDGCIDIVWTEDADTLLVGANTRAFVVPVRPGALVTGARFRPGAAAALLDIAPEELRDARVPVDALWRDAGGRLAETLDADNEPGAALLGWLSGQLRHARAPDPIVRALVQRLRAPSVEPPSVATLARQLAVSERQLRRRVSTAVGYGPKRLARVLRLEQALQAARAGDELARVALDVGYADQAHFANECRELAGTTPTILLAGWTPDRDRFLQDGRRDPRDHPRHEYPTSDTDARLGDRVRGRSPSGERVLPADVRAAA